MPSYELADILYTDNAANKVSTMIDGEEHLRVYIVGGGCSGFSYGFTFDTEHKEGDSIVINGKSTLVVDPMSYQYLVGSTVDYLEDLQGARFIISNPNAKTTCGCGSSFSV
jgi:iron-sulfur cluster insertion protein